MHLWRSHRFLASLALLMACPLFAAEVAPLLSRIKAVGREGSGNAAAAQAWRELARSDAEALPAILTGLDDADATAANWIRAAVDAIAERELAAGHALPADKLEAFVRQTQHAPQARRLAYEWLVRADAKAPDRLLPDMLNDPSTELRRDAVAVVVKEGQTLQKNQQKPAAITVFRKALSGARDRDQVDLIAKEMKTLGEAVDLPAHFGFVQRWHLLGPFDNPKDTGFAEVHPPEKAVDLSASYNGKKESKLAWVEHTTTDPYGVVDLNKALGKNMAATAYAYTAVTSPVEQPVQVRATSNNAVKIFFNGKQIFFREEYHHGMRMDQHTGVGVLKPGRNEILVKVCQNEQTDEWAQNWSFQLRLCDSVGGAVPFSISTEKKATEGKVR